MRVAISGASSFTGAWIASAFSEAGFETHALTAEPVETSVDSSSEAVLRGRRLAKARDAGVTLHLGIRSETGAMAEWISAHSPQVWIHHHHWMKDYRSPDYDLAQARAVGIEPLSGILDALAGCGAAAIFSGSFFEPGEGGRSTDAPATPYSRNKRETWLEFQKLALERSLRAGKVVIPNPIGPLENLDRLIPQMVRGAREGKPYTIRAPESVSDYLPVEELARVYLELTEFLLQGSPSARAPMVLRPSGRIARTLEFAQNVAEELLKKRLGLDCTIEVATELADRGASIEYRNPVNEARPLDWDRFWDLYAAVSK